MRVHELIENLKRFPDDAEVFMAMGIKTGTPQMELLLEVSSSIGSTALTQNGQVRLGPESTTRTLTGETVQDANV